VTVAADKPAASPQARNIMNVLTLLLAVTMLLGAEACRGDGESDGDADGDVDGDVDGDGDADGDGASGGPCETFLGGSCNPARGCGCGTGTCVFEVSGEDVVSEACVDESTGTGERDDECESAGTGTGCAPGFWCYMPGMVGPPGVCRRICESNDVCPERSFCNGSVGVIPNGPDVPNVDHYGLCSDLLPEGQSGNEYCTGAAGACSDGGGTTHDGELVTTLDEETTFSCSVDLSEPEFITVSFMVSGTLYAETADGYSATTNTVTVEAVDLRGPRSPVSAAPMACDAGSFTIALNGTDYSTTECIPGMPTAGACVVGVQYAAAQQDIVGTIWCSEIPAADGDLLTNTSIGSFEFRTCDVTEG